MSMELQPSYRFRLGLNRIPELSKYTPKELDRFFSDFSQDSFNAQFETSLRCQILKFQADEILSMDFPRAAIDKYKGSYQSGDGPGDSAS